MEGSPRRRPNFFHFDFAGMKQSLHCALEGVPAETFRLGVVCKNLRRIVGAGFWIDIDPLCFVQAQEPHESLVGHDFFG